MECLTERKKERRRKKDIDSPQTFEANNNLISHTVHGCVVLRNFENVCSFGPKTVLTVVLKNQNSFHFSRNQIMKMNGPTLKVRFIYREYSGLSVIQAQNSIA